MGITTSEAPVQPPSSTEQHRKPLEIKYADVLRRVPQKDIPYPEFYPMEPTNKLRKSIGEFSTGEPGKVSQEERWIAFINGSFANINGLLEETRTHFAAKKGDISPFGSMLRATQELLSDHTDWEIVTEELNNWLKSQGLVTKDRHSRKTAVPAQLLNHRYPGSTPITSDGAAYRAMQISSTLIRERTVKGGNRDFDPKYTTAAIILNIGANEMVRRYDGKKLDGTVYTTKLKRLLEYLGLSLGEKW